MNEFKKHLFLVLSCILLCKSAFAIVEFSPDIIFQLKPRDQLLSLSITNSSNRTVLIGNPRRLAVLPSDSGVEFSIFSETGQRMNNCAFLDYPTSAMTVRIGPGESSNAEFTIRELRQGFCLPPGSYKIVCTVVIFDEDERGRRLLMSNLASLDVGIP